MEDVTEYRMKVKDETSTTLVMEAVRSWLKWAVMVVCVGGKGRYGRKSEGQISQLFKVSLQELPFKAQMEAN
jgi:hypothetical protein